ncbi:MAG: hypothetical protein A3G49_03025 [Candidatus Sungbacteria bacterium RIFCSPLOWO2_12_FULL_41_11]|uniref:DUF458 domain-containing protein n=1 Tax=Candidatus Sungbacteria bacterium RIFCSPLOWO2_12_FULL_41_11 TaxID=1802286 RepID=A0A1G2LRB7_9BACT|nr:MAG: hypothetical protein UV01_C0001G0108 [Parcubacteria group bacterium GW2011_GWA2_42_14]OHA14188.1 MAG: hypothetical protein A3G49_03025 [Candidatus Sungbacteria bacterium RIFCSPLOWO2_12_FULL_41_11]
MSHFYSQSKGILTLDEVITEVIEFVKAEPGKWYHIIIGSDSASSSPVELVTAVTVWRVGNGAIHFWTKAEPKVFLTLRDRIYAETMNSITLAQEVRSRLRDRLGDEAFWDNQVHIDVGENGPTRELIDTVVGMVKGYGFEAVIKPNSFGASTVADKHT